MYSNNNFSNTQPASSAGYSAFARCTYPDAYFQQMQQEASGCRCPHYNSYFQQNQNQIRERCNGRNSYDYRTDEQGCRYENRRPAQTQVVDQTPTTAVIKAGENTVTFNKADQSMLVHNSDGSTQTMDLKVWGDPHITKDGREIGTLKEDVVITLKDGTNLKLLMGNGQGGKPVPGQQSYVDTVAIRARDGTGVLVTGISGPANIGVTPLDSSVSSDFMERRALNRFGDYEPSHVSVDRNGNFIDQTTGQVVHNQAGLDQLDRESGTDAAAHTFYRQGYVPSRLAEQYDRPYDQYTPEMANDCRQEMARIFQYLQQLSSQYSESGTFGALFARYAQQNQHQMRQTGLYA